MRLRLITVLSMFALTGCSSPDSQNFSVYFPPYSAKLDNQANDTIAAAASFAQSHSRQPVEVTGYLAPADHRPDVDVLSAQRAAAVKHALADDGVVADRITTAATGMIDPKPLPSLAVRRVDINVGPVQAKNAPADSGGFK